MPYQGLKCEGNRLVLRHRRLQDVPEVGAVLLERWKAVGLYHVTHQPGKGFLADTNQLLPETSRYFTNKAKQEPGS